MLFPNEESWSHEDVRKLIGLFASEHLRMQAICDALPVGVGLIDMELQPLWSNKPFRSLWPAIPSSAKQSMQAPLRASLRSGTPVTIPAEPAGHVTFLPSRMLSGEIVVILSREPLAGSALPDEQAHRNIAALEGCLSAAFPDHLVRQLDQPPTPGALQFGIDFGDRESILTVTPDALEAPDLATYLRDIPEALRLTCSVILTAEGVRIN